MKPILLHTEQLTVGYRKKALIPDITFSVQAGQILTLIGANGVGKSTILKSIARQLEPIAGTIFVGEQELSAISHRNLAKSMSILMTHSFQTEFLRCIDVVEAGRYPYTGQLGILSEQDHEKVAEALRLVHGEELAQKDFRKISDGQRQRILLAKAICQEAEILILDEPTSFLDVRYKLEFLTILKDLVREKQIAVILSLHELDLAQRISDVVLCIRNHTVDRIGTPDEIFTDAYITNLYGITCGSYESLYLSLVAAEREMRFIGSCNEKTFRSMPAFYKKMIWIIRLQKHSLQKLLQKKPLNLLESLLFKKQVRYYSIVSE